MNETMIINISTIYFIIVAIEFLILNIIWAKLMGEIKIGDLFCSLITSCLIVVLPAIIMSAIYESYIKDIEDIVIWKEK